MALNRLTIQGFIGTDPELRFSKADNAWCTFRLAHPKRKREGDKWVDNGTVWLDCKAFGKDAEQLAELGKSCPVEFECHLDQDEWADRETGQKRTKLVLIVDRWNLLMRSVVMTEVEEGKNIKGVRVGWKFSTRDKARDTPRGGTEPALFSERPFD